MQQGTTYYWRVVAWDEQGASSSGPLWSFTTLEDDSSPTVTITKPEKGLYLHDTKIRPYLIHNPVIIGEIDVTVNAADFESGIDYVAFYINDDFQVIDDSPPYSFTWDTKVFGKQKIKTIVYDNVGNSAVDELAVWKFF